MDEWSITPSNKKKEKKKNKLLIIIIIGRLMLRNSRFRSEWCRCCHDSRRGIPHQDTRPKASRGALCPCHDGPRNSPYIGCKKAKNSLSWKHNLQVNKVCGCCSVTFLNWTLTFCLVCGLVRIKEQTLQKHMFIRDWTMSSNLIEEVLDIK
jgi:hypothetical protein